MKYYLNAQEIPAINSLRLCEAVWIRFLDDHEKGLNIGVCYRPPASDSNINIMLYDNIKQACAEGETLTMGDFNHPSINWEAVSGQGKCEEFLDVVNDCFLVQSVIQPTRGKSMLDLVLCNIPDIIYSTEVVEPLGTSDHSAVTFDLFLSEADKLRRPSLTLEFLTSDETTLIK